MRYVLLLLLIPTGLYGQDPPPVDPVTLPEITLPETMTVKAGRISVITAETNGLKVRWVAVGVPDGTKEPVLTAEEMDVLKVDEDGKVIHFCCERGGKVMLFAYTAVGDVPSDAAICNLIIEGNGPRPPPEPGPNPVVNLRTKVRDAFKTGTASQRKADGQTLFGVASALSVSLQNKPELIPDLQTFHDQFKDTLAAMGWTVGRYPGITAIIKEQFSNDNEPFTDASRSVVIEKLREIAEGAKAAANEGVKSE